MFVRYRGIHNKGVPERPGTKWWVLIAISITLKCQFTGKCWKVDFLMPCKTKSREKSLSCLRTVRAVTLDTSRPHSISTWIIKQKFWRTKRNFLIVTFRFLSGPSLGMIGDSFGMIGTSSRAFFGDDRGFFWILMDSGGFFWILVDCQAMIGWLSKLLTVYKNILVHLWQKNELDKLENRVFHKQLFFRNSGWHWGGLEVSRVTARTVRRQCNTFSRDLVLHGTEKSTFQHFQINWHFKVVEIALKTIHFVTGLAGKPLLFIPDISPTCFQKYLANRQTLENWKSGNLKSRSWKVSWFVFPQR